MNERIRELYEQARLQAKSIDADLDRQGWMDLYHQKFAELIVRECMACSTWVGKMNTDSVEPVHTAHAVNQRIKQHFGVEE